jgi:hypothetical protein
MCGEPPNGRRDRMKRALFIIFIALQLFLIYSCSTPIEEYQAKDNDEKEIIDLLIRYTEAINTGDSEKILTLFHEKGVYVASDGNITLSREKMSEWKRENWLSYGLRKLYNPEIKLNGNEAEVMVKVKYGNVSYAQIFTLVKENDKWLIMRRE